MSLINENILKEFSVWAEENEDKSIFPEISIEGGDSYYIGRDSEKTYMMEYSFETMAELGKLLEKYSGLPVGDKMLQRLTVGIMQNRFVGVLEKNIDNNIGYEKKSEPDTTNVISEYVYMF